MTEKNLEEVLYLLQLHYEAYANVKAFADKFKHPHPTDTRGWSQIIVSALTGIGGYERKKGPDLEDGSDVKAANCWDAIDTPRFNGCIKAGTQADVANSLASLDKMPYLFFVMWDVTEKTKKERCRIWVVRTQYDQRFRDMADLWYRQRAAGTIRSDNFQLHPPRNLDHNVFRNNCGVLEYPLLFEAHASNGKYSVKLADPTMLTRGCCKVIAN
ncbi:MamI family restriction endonuclease [Desulfopila aestuarii]|uniref:Uncharacterized protein n=1 Tax=Desulfopila aestuarii DSM 18488 TaxID=1121416 RepID=A0A1M7YGR6_9BACT|nr:MamI family restriction endonuclease [Desulfopila aestuarii]SHO51759.1 hypothetical protein SAMN02745220_04213 [Desulfopila aestuarii DSM 18488]